MSKKGVKKNQQSNSSSLNVTKLALLATVLELVTALLNFINAVLNEFK